MNVLFSIQYLRACAVVLVVLNHVTAQLGYVEQSIMGAMGQSGVDIFFVISGFIMTKIAHDSEDSAPDFLLKRAIRIVPVYWFFTCGLSLLLVLEPSLFTLNKFEVKHFLLSLFFVPHPSPAAPSDFAPLLKAGWTLNYEVFFYSVFAASMAISRGSRLLVTSSVFIAIFSLARAPEFVGRFPLIGVYGDSLVFEFVLGMLIGHLFVHNRLRTIGASVGIVLLILGVGLLPLGATYLPAYPRLLMFGLPATAIVCGALVLESQGLIRKQNAILAVGNASYSIYLVHMFPIAVIRQVYRALGLSFVPYLNAAVFLGLSLLIAIGMGLASFKYFEAPVLKFLRTYRFTSTTPSGSTSRAG